MTRFRKLMIASASVLAMCLALPVAGAMAQTSSGDSGSSMSPPSNSDSNSMSAPGANGSSVDDATLHKAAQA